MSRRHPARLLIAVGSVLVLAASAAGVVAQGLPGNLTTVAPSTFAQGVSGGTVQLFGQNLAPGIAIRPLGPVPYIGFPVSFSTVRTLSTTLAVTAVSVRKEAPPGSYRFAVTQPGPKGEPVRIGEFDLRVVAGASLMAPVSVTTLAVVHPLQGTLVAEGERLYPRALLGTTGSGSVSGFWELDGVPFDRFVVQARAGYPVSVSARSPLPSLGVGEHSLVVRLDAPQAVTSEAVKVVRVPPKPTLLRLVTPAPAAAAAADARGGGPVFRWTEQPGAVAYEVVVSPQARETVRSHRTRVFAASWYLPESARQELGAGRHWWSVRPIFPGGVAGLLAEWRPIELSATVAQGPEPATWFDWEPASRELEGYGPAVGEETTSAQTPSGEVEDPSEPATGSGERRVLDWRLDLGGDLLSSTSEGANEHYSARLPATLTVLYEAEHVAASASTDLSFLQEIDPGSRGVQESRAWVANGRLYGSPWGAVGAVGYFGPTAIAGSTLLAAGLVRGGAEGGIATPAGVLRYYGSFDDSPSGTSSSVMGGEQDVAIASWGLPLAERIGSIQLVAVDASDTGLPEQGVPAAEARSYGLIAALALGERWRLELEGAQSSLEQDAGDEQDGNAYRLALAGDVAGMALVVGAQRTESTYLNLASGSLSPGGVPDRTNLDVSLARPFGDSQASLLYHYTSSGEGADGTIPGASQHALEALVDAALSGVLRLAVTASYSASRSDDPIPGGTDEISSWAASANLTAAWERVSLTPSLTWQSTRNNGAPGVELADVDLWSAGVVVNGMVGPAWTLAGNASWTRNEPGAGEALDAILISLQPAWNHARGFRIGPVLTGAWSDIPALGRRSDLQAQLTVGWFPPAGSRCPVGISVTGGWRDTSLPAGAPEPAEDPDGWTASLALSLRWGRGVGATP